MNHNTIAVTGCSIFPGSSIYSDLYLKFIALSRKACDHSSMEYISTATVGHFQALKFKALE